MKCFDRLITVLLALALLWLAVPMRAQAYLDPGTGSYLLQIVLAALFGVLLVIKVYWKRLKSTLANLLAKRKGKEQDES